MTDRQPRAVREASKRAEEIHAEVYSEEQEPPQEPQEPVQEPPQTEPAPAPPAAEEPPQRAPAAPSEPAKPEDTVDYWRNKFRTLDGKYRAEVPRQASQIREATARIQHLEQTLAAMTSAEPATRANGNGKTLVTEEEIGEYGEDFVSMMRRLAQEEAGRAVSQVAPKIEEVRGELQQSRTQTALERLYGLLDSQVEDWRSINRSPEFLEWLDEEDPFAGETRKSLLRDAFDRKDGNRVLTFFTGFLNQQRTVQPPAPADPQTPPARTQPRVKLEDLAGPRSSGGGGQTPAGEEPIQSWTRRQIAAFYKDVQMGVYRNDPDRQRQIEASIHRASTNGLVTP